MYMSWSFQNHSEISYNLKFNVFASEYHCTIAFFRWVSMIKSFVYKIFFVKQFLVEVIDSFLSWQLHIVIGTNQTCTVILHNFFICINTPVESELTWWLLVIHFEVNIAISKSYGIQLPFATQFTQVNRKIARLQHSISICHIKFKSIFKVEVHYLYWFKLAFSEYILAKNRGWQLQEHLFLEEKQNSPGDFAGN